MELLRAPMMDTSPLSIRDKEYQKVIKQMRNEYARKSFGYDYNDLEQEMWLKTYELLQTNDELTVEYLAFCLRNHIRDWFRKEIKYKKMFKPQAGFEGSPEERPGAEESSSRRKVKGRLLKSYLIAYNLYPEGLTIEMRDYIARIYTKLSSTELLVLNLYAEEVKLDDNSKKIMQRILDKFGER